MMPFLIWRQEERVLHMLAWNKVKTHVNSSTNLEQQILCSYIYCSNMFCDNAMIIIISEAF